MDTFELVELVYCAGGNARFAEIAITYGFRYGAQIPNYKIYADLWFADQDWKNPDREAYMAALAKYRPHMATVLDWEHEEQFQEIIEWAEEAAQYVDRVLIIPKVMSGIDQLPRHIGGKQVVLAFSVPTTHGGTEVPIWEFAGWPIHLLGGSPQAQMQYAKHLNAIAEVVSTDGNMANKMAHYCRFWRSKPGSKGHWVQLAEVGDGNWGKGSNAEAFRRSCENIAAAWRNQ